MPIKRIVVGTDGSESANKAVDQAIELAAAVGAELELVNAFDVPSPAKLERMRAEIPDPDFAFAADPANQSEMLLSDIAKKAEEAGVKTRTWSQGGDAASFIIDVATETDADLIVVGNRGMTGAARFLLGSVPNKISHHAPCSVLIAHTT
jgi:nucleotide-binding universal stress UspA family protein